MKKLNKVMVAIACLMPLSAVGAATADATDARERGERQQQARMIVVDREGNQAGNRAGNHAGDRAGNQRGEQMRERMREVRNERLQEHFAQFDLNQDGYITQAELTEVMVNQARERSERMFQRLDTDGTGVVSVEQFAELQGELHLDRHIEVRRRAVNMGELSEEDRERIREARELAREAQQRAHEARAMGAEARREALIIRGDAVEVSVDEEGNRIIRVRNKRADERGNN